MAFGHGAARPGSRWASINDKAVLIIQMSTDLAHDKYAVAKVFILSTILVVLQFHWQADKDFSLWDEGHLWYGVQRVFQGEVPILDFMSYDPGRYYWAATLMHLFGNTSIMSLRAAAAVFQALGLSVGLLLIARSTQGRGRSDYLYWLLAGVTLLLWMYPRHKLYDISVSIFLIGVLSHLVAKPVPARYFLAGLCVGLAAVFGRNHGVYGIAGSLGVMGWLSLKRTDAQPFAKGFAVWSAGVGAGFAPILLMGAFVPGFAAAFWKDVTFLVLVRKAANIPLPVPWPWTVHVLSLPPAAAAHGVLIGLFFVGVLAFALVSVFWVVRQRIRGGIVPPALVAAAFMSVPYAEAVFSRADVSHLAQGMFPLLIGCLALFASQAPRTKWALALLLGLASAGAMLQVQPGWSCRSGSGCANVAISGSSIAVSQTTARDIALLRELANTYASHGRAFVVTPYWPGAYALLNMRSPMWENYALFTHSAAFQQEEIDSIRSANPGFILVLGMALDGSEDMRFAITHPLIYQYIRDHYERVPYPANPAYEIYRPRAETQQAHAPACAGAGAPAQAAARCGRLAANVP